MKHILLSLSLLLLCATAIRGAEPTKRPVDGYPEFAIGGDLSSTSRIVDLGKPRYYKGPSTSSGVTTIPEMAYDYGFDAVRLRVWVDPKSELASQGFSFKIGNARTNVSATHGYCDAADLLSLARTFASQGQRIMVVFQMSDTWADPARQLVPASWCDCANVEELKQRVSAHVTSVLTMLRDANINVAWVQIGNETNTGMLKYNFPAYDGANVEYVDYGCSIGSNATATTTNFVEVFKTAADAARAIYPETKTVLHLAKSASWGSINWTLNLLRKQGFNSEMCDYVGLSLYPGIEDGDPDATADWQTDTDLALETIDNIYQYYGYRTLLCEIGMNNEWSSSVASNSQSANVAQCNTDVEDFTSYLFEKLSDDVNATCDGLFYWEPEMDYLDDYKKGACYDFQGNWKRIAVTANPFWSVCRDNSAFPAGGLEDYEIDPASVESIAIDGGYDDPNAPVEYYNLQGIRVTHTMPGEVYIRRQGRTATKILVL